MRYYITAYIDSFYTTDSGDFGEGEFYFICNRKRFPDKGEIHLSKNETFDPEPNPTVYAALVDTKDKEIKFDFEVWEKDPGRDDKFIDHEFKLPITTMNQPYELTDKKQKCKLKIIIKMEESKNW